MNSYRFRQKPGFQSYGTRTQQRLLVAATVILLAAVIVLGFLYTESSTFQQKANVQFESRINSNLVDAIGQVSRMAGGVQSSSSIKLGLVRQHIHTMDQINTISIAISGESGRVIPQEAVTALYSVLESYEVAVQTATGNTLDLRTLLLTHLMSLQELLNQSD